MEQKEFMAFLSALKDAIGSKIPDDVRKELEEHAEIVVRMRRRIEASGMIPMTELLRYNELCYKHFKELQDIPPDICGVYQDGDSDDGQ